MKAKTFLSLAILIIARCETVAPASEDAAAQQAVVISTATNMYSEPDENEDVVSQAVLGLTVKVLREQHGFAWIETPEPYRGWVRSKDLRLYDSASPTRYAEDGPLVEVTALLAYVYRQPDVKQSAPIVQAPLGARLELVAGEKPGKHWLGVVLPSGQQGYIQSGDVRNVSHKKRVEPDSDELIKTARRLTGVPYLWGGMTPLGVDCSGFVGLVYRVHGVQLRRDAREQFPDPKMKQVERGDLQPGDLLYFGGQRISHVGMYIGDGRFIHSTTHMKPAVQESQLDEPHWSELYRGARRPQ